jgi:hypothetical protein
MNEVLDPDKKALEDFLLDIDCLDALRPWTDRFNIFDVLKISSAEIRHSNMLAWLLDPNENHGYGDKILAGLFQKVVNNDSAGKYDVCSLLLMDLDEFEVAREWKNIDILLTSNKEKTVIVIENKIWSGEHDDQLKRYRQIVEKNFSDFTRRIYLYLTPNGDEASDPDSWISISYTDIVDIISGELSKADRNTDAEVLIRNYVDMLRRDIVNDQELDELCDKIYRKHKKALDLLFAHRTDPRSRINGLVADTLKQLDSEGLVRQCSEWPTSFVTDRMDAMLPPVAEDQGSWKTGRTYHYWFSVSEDGFYCIFELGGFDIPDDEMKHMQSIIDVLKPNDRKRDGFQYKRLYKTKPFHLKDTEDPDEAVPAAVRSAVKNMLEMEDGLLKKIQNNT